VTPRQTLAACWEKAFATFPDLRPLTERCERNIDAHGDSRAWLDAVAALPSIVTNHIDIGPTVSIGRAEECDQATRQALADRLQALQPWRKGPFSLFGVRIDTEWRSDWKWSRVAPHVSTLEGRRVLDAGCGNGYYGWRMCAAGAHCVIGIDPTIVYLMQYLAVAKYLIAARPYFRHAVLPARLEDIAPGSAAFDTVFSMGVLYHRRDPLEHLRALRDVLRPGGELVLETLIVADGSTEVLIPDGRYARMRNVWQIPATRTLEEWLVQAGFQDVRIADITATTTDEQRTTPWMRFASLAQALAPNDPTRTIEGHPAPIRCILIARS
jgi:tRNA (mo5U34)-methyltransferase